MSHLLVIINDEIIRREIHKDKSVNYDCEEHRLKLFLTVLESLEVLFEVSARRAFGKRKKFIVICVIQAIKCIGRLVLILKFKNRISSSPAIEYVDRKNLLKERPKTATSTPNPLQPEFNSTTSSSFTLKLKRSGKTIRKVSNAPSLYSRNFKAPDAQQPIESEMSCIANHEALKNAEILYILKPMIHLGSVAAFGYKSWKSYFTSMLLDLYSIYQYYRHRNVMNLEQKRELSHRCVKLILLIFRSPFYDRFSKDKIDAFMRALNYIPFAKYIVEPYRLYIPSYQDKYFYMYSN
jgi:peroxin-16